MTKYMVQNSIASMMIFIENTSFVKSMVTKEVCDWSYSKLGKVASGEPACVISQSQFLQSALEKHDDLYDSTDNDYCQQYPKPNLGLFDLCAAARANRDTLFRLFAAIRADTVFSHLLSLLAFIFSELLPEITPRMAHEFRDFSVIYCFYGTPRADSCQSSLFWVSMRPEGHICTVYATAPALAGFWRIWNMINSIKY